MRSLPALLLLSACADATMAQLPADRVGPPITFSLETTPPVPGEPMTLTVTGAPPSSSVQVALGSAVGPGTSFGSWSADIVGPYTPLGAMSTDAAGTGSLTLTVPAAAPWTPKALQAVHLAGPGTELSNPVATWVQDHGVVTRGTWMWKDVGNPHGLANIVGNPAAEADAIATMDRYSIDRVYASYDWTPSGAASDIAAWHADLHAAGKTVELLLAENTWIDPVNWPNLDSKLATRLEAFHLGAPPAGHFDGVHLDIEPHALPGWSSMSAADKRTQLDMLVRTYFHVRFWMDGHGAAGIPLHADIPSWYDSLTSSLAWPTAAQRDTWFTNLASAVDGVTIMSFQVPTSSGLLSVTDYERNVLGLSIPVHIAVEARIAPMSTPTWFDANEMLTVAATAEDTLGPVDGVDIQSWSQLRAVVP